MEHGNETAFASADARHPGKGASGAASRAPGGAEATPDDAAGRLGEDGKLLAAVYGQLRALAQERLRAERTGHTLTATALVHEAYLRLAEGRRVPWASKAHYYAAAAEAMRRILLDHARGRDRVKRGGGRQRVPLNVLDLAAAPDPDTILALDALLHRLESEHPDAAAVVRLRFYAGLTGDHTAEALGCSPRQVDRHWSFGRAWLYRAMCEQAEAAGPARSDR